MTNKELLDIYIGLVPFLAEVCGPGTEIVIHDVTDPDNSIIAIGNNLSGRDIGNPMTNLAREIQEQGGYTKADYITNYNGRSKNKDFLSSTYFIKNDGNLIGMLCINRDMSSVEELNNAVRTLFERFNIGLSNQEEVSENLDNPVSNILHNLVTDTIAQAGISPLRMSMQEKIKLVHQLNNRGVLTMKGAVSEIALQLNISEPTVYRYLNRDAD